jgi:ubiquinone/menaquinone biosynthesis C-methylase UbiE
MICRTGTELINPFRALERAGIRERMHVVNFGCGPLGHWTFSAAQMVGPKGTVYAIDILRDALEMLERRAKTDAYANIKYVWSDFDVYRATHVPEGEIDLLILANNFPHSQKPSHLVKEMARLVKRGGKVLVVDWKPSACGRGSNPEKRVAATGIKHAFNIPEFELEDEFDAGPAHYALMFLRTDAAHTPPKDIR